MIIADKEQAEKQSRELSAEIEALREECQELRREIERTTRESERLWSQAAVYEQIIGTLNGKRIEARAKKESIEDLSKYIHLMNESDEWLASEFDKYEERMSSLGAHIATELARHEQLNKDMEKCRQQLGAKMTEAGKLEAEKAQYERQLARRETMIKETARRHNMRGFDTELDDSLMQDFMFRLAKMARDQNLNLERVKRETREELQKAQTALNHLGERRSALLQNKDHAKQEISSNDRRAAAFQAELDRIEVDEGLKATLNSAIEDVESRLKKAKRDYETAAWDERIKEGNEALRSLEGESEDLNQKLIQSTRQAGALAKLEFLKKELKERKTSLQTMTETYGAKIAGIVGSNWQPTSLEREFQSVLDEKRDAVAEAERQRDGVNRELEQVEFRVKSCRDSVAAKSKELQHCTDRIRETIGEEPDTYEEAVATLESDRDIRRGDVDNFKNLQNYFVECIKAAKEKSVCRLCERSFDSKKEYTAFLGKLETLISKTGYQTVLEELNELEEELKRARDVRPSYDSYQRLSKSEIPSLNAEMKKLEERRESLISQVEDQDIIVKERLDALKDVESLQKTVQNITKSNVEIQRLECQTQELMLQRKGTGTSQTIEEIQEQLVALTGKSRSVKSSINKLISDKESARAQITALELELRDLKTRLTDASHQLEKKYSLVARVEEFRATNLTQQQTIERTERDIEGLAPQIAKAQTQYDDISNRGADKERELQQEASRLSDSVNQLKVADQEINTYIDKGGHNQLARCQREVEKLREEIGQLEAEQKQVAVEINKAQKQRDKNDETKRTISDNLRYRRDVRALQTVEAEIAELEAKNAEVDRERFVREADKMGLKHRKLSAEEATKMGAMKSKDDQLLKLLEDWNTDYKDAAQNYKEAHIKVEVWIT